MLEATAKADNLPLHNAQKTLGQRGSLPRENPIKNSEAKQQLDSDTKLLHDIETEFQKIMDLDQNPKTKSGKENIWSKLKKQEWIHWVHKNVFDDDCFARKILSLENELAEGLDPSFEQLKAPKWLRNSFYRVLWTMTFITTGFRSLYEAINEEKGVAGVKKIVQDGVSVVALTTMAARSLNWLQEKLYNSIRMPLLIKNSIRPLLTVAGCVKGIEYFDKVGEPAGEYAVKFIEKLMNKENKASEPAIQAA